MPRGRMVSRVRVVCVAASAVASGLVSVAYAAERSSPIEIRQIERVNALSAPDLGTFHTTANEVSNARLVEVGVSKAIVALWEERRPDGRVVSFFAISPDGRQVARVQPTSYEILLRYDRFDPALGEPIVPGALAKSDAENIYLVQFVTQPLEEYREEIGALGATIYKFVPNHAYLVKMAPEARDQVEKLPFVRWVGPYHPAYRLEEPLVDNLALDRAGLPPTRYNIQVFERGAGQQSAVAGRIEAMGGVVHQTTPEAFWLDATLSNEVLAAVAHMDEVLFIDRWTPPEADMDIVREFGGANFVESTAGFTGAGVRGEVMDVTPLRTTHMDLRSRPPLLHRGTSGPGGHGTNTFGINFGDGTANPAARGMLPSGEGIYAQSNVPNRHVHTAELVQDPYFAVFQSNSWGGGLTTQYTTVSAAMDDILFLNDIVITQSQSNAGSRNSRPEAWAKNIVGVGGIRHYNTLTTDDDCWCGSASIGPAADGRLKPDLAHFYDGILTTNGSSDTAYSPGFGGTSAATPITAGHFGLLFEMWHNGIFGNPTGKTVFDSRPHMTTAKALIVNTARQWEFEGASADLGRAKQGWGRANVEDLYTLSGSMLVINETDVLATFGSSGYTVQVAADGPPLRATLVYADPPGTTSAAQHRINDLTLKLTSPSGEVYWGNNGLADGMWSQPGGDPNTIDTVENVFIQTPEPGDWTVEVFADEVNEDSHTETPKVDADYALVVSGIVPQAAGAPRLEQALGNPWSMLSFRD